MAFFFHFFKCQIDRCRARASPENILQCFSEPPRNPLCSSENLLKFYVSVQLQVCASDLVADIAQCPMVALSTPLSTYTPASGNSISTLPYCLIDKIRV